MTNIIRFIKSRGLWLARHVTSDREESNAYRILVMNLKESNSLEKLGLNVGRVMPSITQLEVF